MIPFITVACNKHAQIKDQLIDEFLIELISDSNFSDEFKLAFIVQLSVAARSIEILGGRVNSSSLTEFRGVRKSNFRYDQEKNLLFVDDIEVAKKRNKIDCREGAIRPVAAKWVREQLLKLGPDEKIYRKSKVAYFKQFKRIHPKLSSHSLRHTSISEMINRGIDSVAISKYMAWSQASTAMSYSHINVRSFVENLYSDKKVA
ncbi:MAG: tyrosine-type recombinase/integrase [Bdellovibrionales bacterium]|nr:tyrosine-type recombinase/integrase [Bdellovibrionales bacterium]